MTTRVAVTGAVVRSRELSPDNHGRYRPCIGHRADGKPVRFNLGTDRKEAEKRAARIRHLYADLIATLPVEPACWSPQELVVVQGIAAGAKSYSVALTSADPLQYQHQIELAQKTVAGGRCFAD